MIESAPDWVWNTFTVKEHEIHCVFVAARVIMLVIVKNCLTNLTRTWRTFRFENLASNINVKILCSKYFGIIDGPVDISIDCISTHPSNLCWSNHISNISELILSGWARGSIRGCLVRFVQWALQPGSLKTWFKACKETVGSLVTSNIPSIFQHLSSPCCVELKRGV